MDGNGRWAKQQGKPRVLGHREGVITVRNITTAAAELDIKYLTLYAFSTENWKRPSIEVNALMSLLVQTLKHELDTLTKNNVRLMMIGDISGMPAKSQEVLNMSIKETEHNTGLTLVLALNYSGKWDILNAVRQITFEVKNNNLCLDSITNFVLEERLSTHGIPDPDLLIRTSGEHRLSNFLLWQIAYSELYFTNVYWPAFTKEDFYQAILSFQNRERRFGMTSEQIN